MSIKLYLIKILILSATLPILTFAKIEGKGEFLPKTFKSQFEQSYISTLQGKEKKSLGVIKYQYPGHIYLEMTSPDQTLFISNQEKSWYYVPPFDQSEEGEVVVQPASNMKLSKLFDTLKLGLVSNKLYTVKEEKEGLLIHFESQSATEMGIEKVLLKFKKGEVQKLESLESMKISYVDKKNIQLNFNEILTDIVFEKDLFTFKIPKNTKVSVQK